VTVCSKALSNNIADLGIASDNHLFYIPYLGGNLSSINIATGEKLWKTELGGRIISAPMLDKNNKKNLYIATTTFGADEHSNRTNDSTTRGTFFLRSINKTTGLTNWLAAIGEEGQAEEIFLHDFREKIIVVNKNGFISAFNKSDGQSIWKISLDKTLTSTPFFLENTVTIAVDKKILTISLENASVLFQSDTAATPTTLFLLDNNNLFWGDSSGNVYAINIMTKKVFWRFRNGAQISYITFTSRGLLLTSYDNFVYLVSATKGKQVWKKRLSGRITIEPLIVGNLVIISSLTASEVFVLDLLDGRLINRFSFMEENLPLNQPLLRDNLLIFTTIKGIFAFSQIGGRCA